MYVRMSGFMKAVSNRTLLRGFLSRDLQSGRYENERNVFFFPPLSYLPFLALLSIFVYVFIAWSDFKTFRSGEIKGHMGDLLQSQSHGVSSIQ